MHPYLNLQSGGERFLQAFSWMLVHSLWQGLLLAVVTALLLQFTKRAPARLRYNIIFIQFVLFILACIWTFFRGMSGPSESFVPLAGAIGQNASQLLNINAINVQLFADACAAYISTHASTLVLIWAVFFTFRSFRMVQGLIYLQKTKHRCIQVAADWQERLVLLCNKLHISKSVQLVESALVKVPMVIGHLKPVILMPAGLLSGLPVEQLEAVLLHELAHIRRHDYIVNLLQSVCETVYFFNPGLLWISGLLRDEREHCCDDIALGQTGNKKEFIQALISFKEHAMYSHASAVAFPGKKNQLLQRVSRIINNKNQPLGTGEKVFFMTGVLLLTAILSTAAITQLRSIESHVFSKQHNTARNYIPPQQLQLSDIAPKDSVAPVKPADPVIQQKEHLINNVKLTPPVIRRHATITREPVMDKHYEEKLLADDIQREQPDDDRRRDEMTPTRPQYTARNAQRENWSAYKEAYVPENKRRPGRLSELRLIADGRELRLTAHEITAEEHQREEARLAHLQAQRDKLQADLDREQAEKDRQQADKDREQAIRDRVQADKDREQARLDRLQAEKDRMQANLDRIQADKDRARTEAEKRQLQLHNNPVI
ncbi:M56 family metallopeptidase [Chitinophaga filiformis]|uniref:Signal transducer regulating beta-lactamase production, contains metallopeptidase domain n=1 Tax=Chitinophaga filiformis TaxID=104663 RepID=A0A1G8AHG0_CHIFI|nr:M56 family metallopeptidase [Chitinophaga filiformis]SDH20445.1 Signal transducer regulating beta-lactamase production, contains metallopeptidase domain [Chitinophaga filiformis]